MKRILLHSCCAPCSAAILEWLGENGYDVTIFFYNPNIYPEEEYLKRKSEIVGYANSLGVPIVDMDEQGWSEQHSGWLSVAEPLAAEPERGNRCLECFKYRLAATAKYGAENGFDMFTTTLASSRWKSLEQINLAGRYAQELVDSKIEFWEKNWRKGGLYERRNLLAKQFYNQQYCGCEFSVRK
ncbi:MAG: epoxyqueuosine reductase QueH [Bacteroidales bacterium]|nr:epoxyqueuosine reductase QueH [Bacteroidales bacterium]